MSGPYLISDPSLLVSLVGKIAVTPPIDSAYGVQCVGLVKVYGKCPRTPDWRQGSVVKTLQYIQRGTVIATFIGGIYPSHKTGNHVCFFIEFLPDRTGFMVLEQHVKPNPNVIQIRKILFRGESTKVDRSDNGDAYSIVL
jgi:hypothetical protein